MLRKQRISGVFLLPYFGMPCRSFALLRANTAVFLRLLPVIRLLYCIYVQITNIHTHYATPLISNDESDLSTRYSAERRTA